MSSFVTPAEHDRLTAQLAVANRGVPVSQADGYAGELTVYVTVHNLPNAEVRRMMRAVASKIVQDQIRRRLR